MNEQNRPASGGGSPKTVTTGSFRFAQAHLRGVVVRDGPVTRHSQAGTPWTECTLLVGLYDGRQKCERERPAFVRVKAFGDHSALLDGLQKRDHVSVAGALAIDVWEDRETRHEFHKWHSTSRPVCFWRPSASRSTRLALLRVC